MNQIENLEGQFSLAMECKLMTAKKLHGTMQEYEKYYNQLNKSEINRYEKTITRLENKIMEYTTYETILASQLEKLKK